MVTPSLPLKAFYKNNIFFQPWCSNFILHSEMLWRWGLHGTPHQDTRSRYPQVQFSSVAQSWLTLCDPMECSTPGSLSITSSQSFLKLMSIELMIPSNHLILCRPLLLLPSIFPSIRVFSSWVSFFASGGQSTSNLLINPSMLASFPLLPHFHILPVFPGIFSQRSHLPQILVSGPSLGYPVQGVIPLPHFLACIQALARLEILSSFLTKVVAKNSKQSNIYFKEQGKNAEVWQTADFLSSELLIGRLPRGNKWYRLWSLWRWLWIVLYFSSHFFLNLLPLQ